MFQSLSESRKQKAATRAIQRRIRLQKQVDDAQGIENGIMQKLEETNHKLKSRRLQLSARVGTYTYKKIQLKTQIRGLKIEETSLRRRLHRNQLDKNQKLAALRDHDRIQAMKQEIDTNTRETMEIQSAIKFHQNALKKTKSAENKAAHKVKIADLKKEYKKVHSKKCALKRDY